MENLQPEPFRRTQSDHVYLDPKIIELHLQTNVPVSAEKARMIYLMNLRLQGIDPEFDPNYGPGIARDGEW